MGQIWESKLLQSRAVDGMPAEGQQVPRQQQYVYPHVGPVTQQVQSAVPRETQRGKCHAAHIFSYCSQMYHFHTHIERLAEF